MHIVYINNNCKKTRQWFYVTAFLVTLKFVINIFIDYILRVWINYNYYSNIVLVFTNTRMLDSVGTIIRK